MVQIKNTVTLTAEIDEKKVKLVVDAGISLGLVYDAVCQIKSSIVKLIQDSEEENKPAEEQESETVESENE